MSRSAERVQGFIGKALIAGVFLAGLIVAFGGILFLLATAVPRFTTTSSVGSRPTCVRWAGC